MEWIKIKSIETLFAASGLRASSRLIFELHLSINARKMSIPEFNRHWLNYYDVSNRFEIGILHFQNSFELFEFAAFFFQFAASRPGIQLQQQQSGNIQHFLKLGRFFQL